MKKTTFKRVNVKPKYSDTIKTIGSVSNIRFRDMVKFQPISVLLNPTNIANKTASVYPIFNNTNKIIDANYKGTQLLAGNSLNTLSLEAIHNLKGIYDMAYYNMYLNYNYTRPKLMEVKTGKWQFNPDDETPMWDGFVKSLQDAMALTYGETYREQAFFNLRALPTDGIHYSTYYEDKDSDTPVVTDKLKNNEESLSQQRMRILNHYQVMLQNLALVINAYNRLKASEDYCKMMSFGNETVQITEVFGLLNKKTMNAQLDGLRSLLSAEYIDTEWYNQVNSIINIPSRKSDSLLEPIIYPNLIHKDYPIEITDEKGNLIYNANGLKIKDERSIEVEGKVKTGLITYRDYWQNKFVKGTLNDVIKYVIELLNPSSIIRWSRVKFNSDAYGSKTNYEDQFPWVKNEGAKPNAFYNHIYDMFSILIEEYTRFSTITGDIRVALKTAADSGLTRWKTGLTVGINGLDSPTRQTEIKMNKFVMDLLRSRFTGSSNFSFNEITHRYEIFTILDKNMGLPSFEGRSGGVILTLPGKNKAIDDFLGLYSDLNEVFFINRYGRRTVVQVYDKAIPQQANLQLGRLNLVNNNLNNMNLRFPMVTVHFLNKGIEAYDQEEAFLVKAVTDIFGFCLINKTAGPDKDNYDYDLQISSDILMFVDAQVDNVANDIFSYSTYRGPFVINKSPLKSDLGFSMGE